MSIKPNQKLSAGIVHRLPSDLYKILTSAEITIHAWEDITPLARNEWICWVEDAKKPETRQRRIDRTKDDLMNGKRRPCCWAGCPHRPDKPPSPSQKFVFKQQ